MLQDRLDRTCFAEDQHNSSKMRVRQGRKPPRCGRSTESAVFFCWIKVIPHRKREIHRIEPIFGVPSPRFLKELRVPNRKAENHFSDKRVSQALLREKSH